MDKSTSGIKPSIHPTLFIFSLPLIILAIYVLIYGNQLVFLYINNNFHTSFLDTLMPYFTMMGEWVVVAPAIIITAFYNYKRALGITIASVTAFILVQLLKEFVFPDIPRPAGVFHDNLSALHILKDTKLHSSFSFPSGHSAGGFVYCISLAFYLNKNFITIALLLIACLTAWSRMYLAQHFPIDVAAGGLIGISCAFLMEILIEKSPRFKGGDNFMTLFRKNK